MTAMHYNITLLKEAKFSNFENQALARTNKDRNLQFKNSFDIKMFWSNKVKEKTDSPFLLPVDYDILSLLIVKISNFEVLAKA
jgi:hypothetical protein